MRFIALLLLTTLALFGANAKDAAFLLGYGTNYDVALQKAKKEHKILMMVIVKDPCPYCDRLVDDTLDTPQVKAKLSKFVPLIIDINGKYPKEFQPPFSPMTTFINPVSEKLVLYIPGYVEKKSFLQGMQEALKSPSK